jgi:hypothetical protein
MRCRLIRAKWGSLGSTRFLSHLRQSKSGISGLTEDAASNVFSKPCNACPVSALPLLPMTICYIVEAIIVWIGTNTASDT